jgi:hypothetical protein
MSTRKSWYDWISEKNTKQIGWAAHYLRAKGATFSLDAKPMYEQIIALGCEMPDTSDTREKVRHMRNAWNQKKFRDQSNGKKSFSFMLPITTKKKLDDLAKQQPDRVSTTEMLERVIFRDTDLQEIHKLELKKLKEELQKLKKEHAKEIVTHTHAEQDLAKPLVSALMQQCRGSLQSNEERLARRGTLEDQDSEADELFKQRRTEIISSANQDGRKFVQARMREAHMTYKQQAQRSETPDRRDACFGKSNTLESHPPANKAHLATHEQTQDSDTED